MHAEDYRRQLIMVRELAERGQSLAQFMSVGDMNPYESDFFRASVVMALNFLRSGGKSVEIAIEFVDRGHSEYLAPATELVLGFFPGAREYLEVKVDELHNHDIKNTFLLTISVKQA